jgi:hypothetical protein
MLHGSMARHGLTWGSAKPVCAIWINCHELVTKTGILKAVRMPQ